MAAKPRKDDYTDFEKDFDIEIFRDSVLNYFSSIPDPRNPGNLTYKLEHIFFIILSAMIAGAIMFTSFFSSFSSARPYKTG